jgi:Tc toxin complex TcA C-terminal TcB-binding domain
MDINVMRLDYYDSSTNLQGVGAGDELQLDLATLHSRFIENTREVTPIEWTVSMSRDFQLDSAVPRNTGKCSISTSETALRKMYPVTYG